METFHQLIDQLIKLNRENTIKKEAKFLISPIQYALEYCTVKIDIGRGTGKSKYIIKNAQENDLIILTKKYHFQQGNKFIDILTPGEVLNQPWDKIKKYSKIWIDNASYIDHHTLMDIYRKLCFDYEHMFILLG